jgi:hypothetical protein
MNNKFDEFTRGLALSSTRRQALHRIGLGLGGAFLASLGIGGAQTASAQGTLTCCIYECESIDGFTVYRQRVCTTTGGCLSLNRCRLVSSHPVADCTKCKGA